MLHYYRLHLKALPKFWSTGPDVGMLLDTEDYWSSQNLKINNVFRKRVQGQDGPV